MVLKKPAELTLGRSGAGLGDVALAESYLEKSSSDNVSEVVLLANTGLSTAESRGTLEMQFVALAILARCSMMQGSPDSAYQLLDGISKRAQEAKMSPLCQSIDAMRTRLDLVTGKGEAAANWLETQAPNEKEQFRILERYRYMTKVRCYIQQEKYVDALALLSRMMAYFKSYYRIYGIMEAGILMAITRFRMKQEGWQEALQEALLSCQKYGFIRLPAEEGIALWELLQKSQLNLDKNFYDKLSVEVRRHAILYPDYLKPTATVTEPLTDTERTVLHLLVKGLRNDDIAQLMDISLRTVKFHTGNIYAKLGVKSRSQAIKAAADVLN